MDGSIDSDNRFKLNENFKLFTLSAHSAPLAHHVRLINAKISTNYSNSTNIINAKVCVCLLHLHDKTAEPI